ncbi:hypothetical protein NDU88_007848 [Pleurodeles waltl]|uniref:Uncharacterized protein n=1 Tax=Pleurodeles waltl TaxID=8319 RepID=A0AAV7N588_PLEWA|nr:hypothetical protein NDU88_007848 [Pleurodeles waltl]
MKDRVREENRKEDGETKDQGIQKPPSAADVLEDTTSLDENLDSWSEEWWMPLREARLLLQIMRVVA